MKFILNLRKKYKMTHYEIKKLKLFGHHGVYEEEKNEGQFFFIDISFDSSNKIKTDKLSCVIDYAEVCDNVKHTFNNKRYNLMETLLNDIRKNLIDKFKKSLEGTQGIVDIRGKGLMIGIELEKDCPNLVEKALENKLLINVTSGKVIRLLPPLIMNEKEADQVVSILTSILKKY